MNPGGQQEDSPPETLRSGFDRSGAFPFSGFESSPAGLERWPAVLIAFSESPRTRGVRESRPTWYQVEDSFIFDFAKLVEPFEFAQRLTEFPRHRL